MTKKKVEVVGEEATEVATTTEGASLAVVETPMEDRVEPEPWLPYRLGQWGGLTQWACRLCPWDTLEGEAAMMEHLAARHAPPAPPPALIQVYDAGGRPVERATKVATTNG